MNTTTSAVAVGSNLLAAISTDSSFAFFSLPLTHFSLPLLALAKFKLAKCTRPTKGRMDKNTHFYGLLIKTKS